MNSLPSTHPLSPLVTPLRHLLQDLKQALPSPERTERAKKEKYFKRRLENSFVRKKCALKSPRVNLKRFFCGRETLHLQEAHFANSF